MYNIFVPASCHILTIMIPVRKILKNKPENIQ